MRPACRRTRVDPDGTPVCGHGERMYHFGRGWHCAVRIKERQRARYAADTGVLRERIRRYKAEHRDRLLANARERYDPDLQREKNARRVRVLGIYVGTVGFTASETEDLVNGPPIRSRCPRR